MTLVASLLLLTSFDQARATALEASLPPTSKATECHEPEGWNEVAQRNPRYVVFGEIHGTQQGPEFIGSLACALATKGERVLVAVEKSATDDPALQTAWALPKDQFQKSLGDIGWTGRQDGVASQAMFAMLVGLHGLKEKGLPIGIVAFNGDRDAAQSQRFADLAGQGPHEAAQAENIVHAAQRANYDRVLILVGNFHARKRTVDWGGARFDPMAARLNRYDNTLALNMRYAAGTSWNCVRKAAAAVDDGKPLTDEGLDCGIHQIRGSADLGRSPFVELVATENRAADDYDGFFWVGPVTGSPPFAAQ
ncbi:hypothetical protein [Sphingopyxis solisilvae]|uniref:hypothetical protein n=1 Tax=Sphingopyxis solisilvae TaxID=1886788 RepID=UPI0018929971|nr:hypothetical protein [Sphingopyxis solisilvae]